MRFREVRREVREVEEIGTREKGLNGVAAKMDMIEGIVNP